MRIAYSSLAAFKAKAKHLSSLLDIPSRTAALELLATLSGYKDYHEVANSPSLVAGSPTTADILVNRLVELKPSLPKAHARGVVEALNLNLRGALPLIGATEPDDAVWFDGIELFPDVWCSAPAEVLEDTQLDGAFFPFVLRLAGPGVPPLQSDGDRILRILCIMCTQVDGDIQAIPYVPIAVPSKHAQDYAGNGWLERTPQAQAWFQSFAVNERRLGLLVEGAAQAGAHAINIHREPPDGAYSVRTVPPVGNLTFDGVGQVFEQERDWLIEEVLPAYFSVLPSSHEELPPEERAEALLKNGTGMSVTKMSTYVLKQLHKEMRGYLKAHPRRASMSVTS